MIDIQSNSPNRRNAKTTPSDVLIKILGACLIVAGIAVVAVEIRNANLDTGDTQEYLSREAWERAHSKQTPHYSDPIRPRGKDSHSVSGDKPMVPGENAALNVADSNSTEDLSRTGSESKLAEASKIDKHSKLFHDRRGPVGRPRKSDWQLRDRNRDELIAAVQAHDREVPAVGDPDDWQWDDAEVYVDTQGNYLLWVFYRNMNRGKIWRWVEVDSNIKRIESSGWEAG